MYDEERSIQRGADHAILKQAEGGVPISELCHELEMSSESFYKWGARFDVIDASMISEMKNMAKDNRRLKRMYAEMSIQNDLLKEALGKSAEAVSKARDGHESSRLDCISIALACHAFEITETFYRDNSIPTYANDELAD